LAGIALPPARIIGTVPVAHYIQACRFNDAQGIGYVIANAEIDGFLVRLVTRAAAPSPG
jgi:hypothetical protein